MSKVRRVRTPTVLQMEATECGAASLAMILGHYGRWLPLEELRQMCGVSRDGSKASNVLRAARLLGMAAKGFRKEPSQLLDLPVPSIIHWNFNHYVVFEGIARGRVWLNDPASGRRSVPLAELDESFTGVVLAFEPTPEFRRNGTPPSLAQAILRYLDGSRDAVAAIVAATLLLVLPGIVLPAFVKAFIDQILVAEMEDWLVPLCLGIAATAMINGALTLIQQRWLARLEAKLAVAMSADYLWRLLRLPMSFFAQRGVGDLAGRVEANGRVARLLSGEFAGAAFSLLSIVFYGLILIAYEPRLAALGIGLAGTNILVLRLSAPFREDLSRPLANTLGKLGATTIGIITGIESIKAGGGGGDAFRRWSGQHALVLDGNRRLGRLTAALGALPGLVSGVSAAAVLGLGGLSVMEGRLSVGELVAFQALLTQFTTPIDRLIGVFGNLQLARGEVARLADIVHHPPDPLVAAAETATPVRVFAEPRLCGALTLRGVTFGYNPAAEPLLKDFSLDLPPGMRVALVGQSGSGKSTVGRLACGLLTPWSGEVLLDGLPLAAVPRALMAASVAYVDQDVLLFEGSVRENLTLWREGVADAVLERALADAAILDEVMARPGGLDGRVAEGAVNFSGGQRQRLEIARALAADPTLLVLDEATSALDPVSEHWIDGSLRRRGCACLIIAHRLSTVRDCDHIIALKSGRVAERGSHAELMAAEGEYAALASMEAG